MVFLNDHPEEHQFFDVPHDFDNSVVGSLDKKAFSDDIFHFQRLLGKNWREQLSIGVHIRARSFSEEFVLRVVDFLPERVGKTPVFEIIETLNASDCLRGDRFTMFVHGGSLAGKEGIHSHKTFPICSMVVIRPDEEYITLVDLGDLLAPSLPDRSHRIHRILSSVSPAVRKVFFQNYPHLLHPGANATLFSLYGNTQNK